MFVENIGTATVIVDKNGETDRTIVVEVSGGKETQFVAAGSLHGGKTNQFKSIALSESTLVLSMWG